MRDIELKAVLGPADSYTFDRVLSGICEWNDVDAAVVIRNGAVAAKLTSAQDLDQLASQAPAIYGKVRDLANDLGFTSSEAFTLRTGRGVISFFAEGETCLSVLHQEPEFEPGVREKLVLVARGVAQLPA